MSYGKAKCNVSQHKPENTTGRRRLAGRFELLGLVALVVALLLPFLGRAFSIDDPLFIWMGQQILEFPLDPYGFSVNWSGIYRPMSEVMQNPPLNSYFIAGVIFLAGLSETVMHVAFLLPAIAAASGTYLVARRFCARPLEATLAAILTPAFLVCGSTVMCDMMLLAFWVWTIHFWVRGIDDNNIWMIVLASVLIVLSAWTKYYGVVLLPLLLVHSFLTRRKPGWWILGCLIPIAALIAYNYWTESIYSQRLMLDAFEFSGHYRAIRGMALIPKSVITLAFAGGCLASVIFLAPLLWTRRVLAVWIGVGALLNMLFFLTGTIGDYPLKLVNGERWILAAHLSLFAAGGASLLTLAIKDLAVNRDADSVLLFLWLAGTVVFVGLLNWTVNGRTLLPAAPALGIIMMRRIEQRRSESKMVAAPLFVLPWILSSLAAFSVAYADCQFANSQRTAAYIIHQKFSTSGTMWFQGHWGFQYYMERLGAKPLGYKGSISAMNDIVVIPKNNTVIKALPNDSKAKRITVSSSKWLSTMNNYCGTAFHSDLWGPIPYGFGLTAPEIYDILTVKEYKLSIQSHN